MTLSNEDQIRELFERCLRLKPADHEAFLAEACGGDHELAATVTGLILTAEETTEVDVNQPET